MTDRDYNECVRLHADGLYRFILKNIKNGEDARDIVQTAFEKMWRKRETVDTVTSKSFLFTVAYNEMIDQLRKKHNRVTLTERPLYQNRSDDHKKWLEIAFSQLTRIQRTLVLLKDWEGYSYEEIAAITGLNITQVKVYLHRSRLQLKKFFGSVENIIETY